MTAHDTGVTELLRRASDGLTPDVDRLVVGGITRGRSRQRRARIGTTVASLAVIGVVGGLAAVVPRLGAADSAPDPGFATDGSATATQAPTVSPTAPAEPADVELAGFGADEMPAMVVDLIGTKWGERPEPTVSVVDQPDLKRVEFTYDGMLTTLGLERAEPLDERTCAQQAGQIGGVCVLAPPSEPMIRWGPTLADGVTCQGANQFRGGWEIYVTSCNAAVAKDSTTLADAPPITIPELVDIATSDVWFAP
ncbi:hypothetical protein ASC64_01185 [Nocardioides sp. Root122]|uniref:hypothetical protein n=1 Tax=Nocardioides TaxID=1839 RepID=UPI000702FF1E|nr:MULTISPECIES: hypothetical protein [Nocardioides]KQV77492.1 hypothetical protein ASC64_01185 [Nocardioides sp. Root122]MCK9821917.1 hypothetical protein [Nocardioides cavernae]